MFWFVSLNVAPMGRFSTQLLWLYQDIEHENSEILIAPRTILKPLPVFQNVLNEIDKMKLDFLDLAVKSILEYSKK